MESVHPPYLKYADADGYDRYMGGWSAALCDPFLKYAGLTSGAVVDIGCGTGNLLASCATAYPRAALTGIDPSAALLRRARLRPELVHAELLEGRVERLPLPDASFDLTLSLLVLQEFTDRTLALSEMRRITRPGGVVAACQWDFARMPVIATLMAAIEVVDPPSLDRIAFNSPRVFEDEGELREHWERAGLLDVRTGRISATQTFATFDDLFRPLLAGSTPSTLALASLPAERQDTVRSIMKIKLGIASETEPLRVRAEAFVVRGTAPPVPTEPQ